MSIHVTCDPCTHTYTISSGTGQEICGLSRDEWRCFLDDVRDGVYNAGSLYHEALARHRKLENA